MSSPRHGQASGSVRVLVAGATGAVGRALVPILIDRGFVVLGTTRATQRAASLRAAGATPLVIDVFDRERLIELIGDAGPDVVIHQLTDLTTRDGQLIGTDELARNARLRDVGTANLVEAAEGAGVRRLIAASVAWLRHPAGRAYHEAELVEPGNESEESATDTGVAALERQVMSARAEDIVLRYGRLYGPGTGVAGHAPPPAVHVDAAAWAAALAIDRGTPGIYNVVDDVGQIASHKARESFGWTPSMRRPADSRGKER